MKLSRRLRIFKMALFTIVAITMPVEASSIAITYNLSGTGAAVNSTATTLTLAAQASGSILSGDPALDAAWNPVTYSDQSVLDFTTNLLHGNFTLTFLDGDTLSGTVDEDQSVPDANPSGTGPFTQILTFTGGTGQFAGSTGSVSGNGFQGTTDFTVSGSGVINTSAVPEPAPGVLLFTGLALIILGRGVRSRQKRPTGLLLSLLLTALPAAADSTVYAITSNQQFGTFDLSTGNFNPIGPGIPEAASGLVPGPNGNLLTLTASGNLDAINPGTGQVVSSLPTGLGNCTAPLAGQCGPSSANTIAELGGVIYATDYQSSLYVINPGNGAKTFIAQTGVPPVSPLVPYSANPDGSLNFYGEGMIGVGGKLYSTFFTGTLDPNTFAPTAVLPDHLYSIDATTGATVNLDPNNPAPLGIDTLVAVSGTVYAFANASGDLDIINLTNGATNTVGTYDPGTTGLIFGATPTPKPCSIAFVGGGIALLIWKRSNKRGRRTMFAVGRRQESSI